MIMINGQWEYSDNLHDISKIIRRHYNYELADIMDNLIDTDGTQVEQLMFEINNLEAIIEELEFENEKLEILASEAQNQE